MAIDTGVDTAPAVLNPSKPFVGIRESVRPLSVFEQLLVRSFIAQKFPDREMEYVASTGVFHALDGQHLSIRARNKLLFEARHPQDDQPVIATEPGRVCLRILVAEGDAFTFAGYDLYFEAQKAPKPQ